MKPAWQAPDFRAALLCLTIVCHGLFSSPSPADPGIAEAIIAIGLALAILPQLPQFLDARAVMKSPAHLAWLWLFFISLGIGVIAGNSLRDVSRDLIAMLFLGLPILLGTFPQNKNHFFAWAVAVAGTLLAARYWWITGAMPWHLKPLKLGDQLLYLALDPAVLFAAVFLPIQLIDMRGKTPRAWLLRGGFLLGAFLCWGAMGGMQMRGALVLGFLSLSLYAFAQYRRPIIPIIMGICAAAVIITFWPALMEMLEHLWAKQQQVGFNARDDDLRVIWQSNAGDLFSLLFGRGMGAVYASPAVGGYWVNYSASALGFFLFKTGLCGLAAIVIYLWNILGRMRRHPLLFAILPPLILGFTLYTSYKFFSCGILLFILRNLHADSDPQSR